MRCVVSWPVPLRFRSWGAIISAPRQDARPSGEVPGKRRVHRVLAPKLATRDSKLADFVRLATRLLDPDTPLHHHCAPGAEMGAGYAAVVVSIHGVAARMFQVGSILASACGPVT